MDISSAGAKGAVVALKKVSVSQGKPAKALQTTTIKKSVRPAAKSVRNLLATYRPDLENAALARLTRVAESQKPARVAKPKKLRSSRARKATA